MLAGIWKHSRIYIFGTGQERRVYIASGDFLTRNTERRVEIGVKIEDPVIKNTPDYDDALSADRQSNARRMLPDGTYTKVKREEDEAAIDSQMEMYNYFANSWADYYASYHLERHPSGTVTVKPKKVSGSAPRAGLLRRLRDRLTRRRN